MPMPHPLARTRSTAGRGESCRRGRKNTLLLAEHYLTVCHQMPGKRFSLPSAETLARLVNTS
jgi:hypothetical protein